MRLICPNCAAQYEVDDSVIPDAGRDVQCSNCGQTWFQPGKAAQAAAAFTPPDLAPVPEDWDLPEAEVEPQTEPQTDHEPQPAGDAAAPGGDSPEPPPFAEDEFEPEPELPAAAASAGFADAAEDTAPGAPPARDADEDAQIDAVVAGLMRAAAAPVAPGPGPELASAAPTPGATPRRALDDSLLAILREEAEREAQARRAEGSALETQEELALAPAVAPAAAATAVASRASAQLDQPAVDEADRVAYLSEDEAPAEAGRSGARRERLPDIEEINSTLRATSDRAGQAAAMDAPQTLARQRSGFRLGFGTVLAIGIVAAALYALAPRLVQGVPALAPAMARYVAAVDAGRIWLDGQLQVMIEKLQPPEP